MNILRRGFTYTADNTDLKVKIINIRYQNDKYARVKLTLVNKRNGIVYEVNKNYKIYKKNITHWKVLQ